MPDIVNLNRARKAKVRTASEAKAAGNRIAFGRSKAEKDLARAKAEKALRDLDAGRRER